MNNGVKNLFSFIAGAAIASAITWNVAKRIYEEEIESVKEVYSKRAQRVESNTEVSTDEPTPKTPKEELNAIIEENGYASDDTNKEKKGGSEDIMANEDIFVISPNEFGDEDDYDVRSFTYYTDGVITDDMDNIVEDVEELIGEDIASHFGEYEDDSVFVRNDRMKAYYEILMDCRSYSEVVNDPNPED